VAKGTQCLKDRIDKVTKRPRRCVGRFVRRHRLLMKVLRAVINTIIFLILCLDDVLTPVLYFRKSKEGLVGWERVLFVLATIVSNLYWIGFAAILLEVVRRIFFGP